MEGRDSRRMVQTPLESRIRIHLRRPLFAALAGAVTVVWIIVMVLPGMFPWISWEPREYEPFRGKEVQLTGRVCSLEPKLEKDGIVWKMLLSDVSVEMADGTGMEAGEGAAGSERQESPTQRVPISAEGAKQEKGTAGIVRQEESLQRVPAEGAEQEKGAEESMRQGGSLQEDPPAVSVGKRDFVLCILDAEPELEMSAYVRVRGVITPFRGAYNEGEFDVRRYYHILRVAFSLRRTQILADSAPADRAEAVLYRVKRSLSDVIDRVFSEHNAPVLRALLLGEKGLLEEETRELYQDAGILHILSISGFHLSLVGMGFFSLCRKLPLPVRAAAAVGTMLLYGKMAGMGTSVVRALVMLTLYITSKVIGRTYDLLTAAGIACVLLLSAQPLYLLHTGFQFSFSAVLAIGILLPALPGKALKALAIPLGTLPVYLWAYGTFPPWSVLLNLLVLPLMTAVMASAGAAVFLECLSSLTVRAAGSLPTAAASGSRITAAAGGLPAAGRASLIARAAGDLLLSTAASFWSRIAAASGGRIAAASGSRTAAAAGGLPATGRASLIARAAGVPAELILRFWGWLAELSQMLPGHTIVLGRPAPVQILCYYLLLAACACFFDFLQAPATQRRLEEGDSFFRILDNREKKRLACACAGFWILAALLVLSFRRAPAFEMDILYVGQGDGIYMTCEGHHFLIDGGSSSKTELAGYTLLPFFHCRGVSRLDGVFITHGDTDHCSGLLELLEKASEGKPQIGIGAVYLTETAEETRGENISRILELSRKADIPVVFLSRGQRLRAGNLSFYCLHPQKGAAFQDPNQSSMTLLAECGGFHALLTGDLEGEGEADFLQYLRGILHSARENRGQEEEEQDVPDDPDKQEEPAFLQKQNSVRFLQDMMDMAEEIPGQGDAVRIQVLKVAHHGSRNATGEEFLRLIKPRVAVISAGVANLYGHPHEELLQRLAAVTDPDRIYRTDLSGQISIRQTRRGTQVETFRSSGVQ